MIYYEHELAYYRVPESSEEIDRNRVEIWSPTDQRWKPYLGRDKVKFRLYGTRLPGPPSDLPRR